MKHSYAWFSTETAMWDPNITNYKKAKRAMLDPYGQLKPPGDRNTSYSKTVINYVSHTPKLSIAALNSLQANAVSQLQGDSVLNSIEPFLNDAFLSTLLNTNWGLFATYTKHRQGIITAEHLANKWKIPIHQAKNTIKRTSQRGIWKIPGEPCNQQVL